MAGNQMKDVDEYVQLNYSSYCDLLLLGFTDLWMKSLVYVTAVILTSVMNIKGENWLRFATEPRTVDQRLLLMILQILLLFFLFCFPFFFQVFSTLSERVNKFRWTFSSECENFKLARLRYLMLRKVSS